MRGVYFASEGDDTSRFELSCTYCIPGEPNKRHWKGAHQQQPMIMHTYSSILDGQYLGNAKGENSPQHETKKQPKQSRQSKGNNTSSTSSISGTNSYKYL